MPRVTITNTAAGFVLLGAMALGVVLLFSASALNPHAGVETAPRCFAGESDVQRPDPQWAYYDYPNQPPSYVIGKPIQLALLPEQATTMHFGRSRAVRAMDIDYKLSLQGAAAGKAATQAVDTLRNQLGKSPIQLDLSQFKRSDGATLDPDLVKARARVVGDRVRLTLCVNRTDADQLGSPGTYQGAVSIIDPRIARVDLPLVVDASYPSWTRPLSLVLLALLAGSWVTWVVKEQKPDSGQFQPSQWARWSITAIGIISVVAGAVAALAVYQSSYLSSATWGSSTGDFLTLLTASFVAFMGATTGLHVATLAERYHREKGDTTTSVSRGSRRSDTRRPEKKVPAPKKTTPPTNGTTPAAPVVEDPGDPTHAG